MKKNNSLILSVMCYIVVFIMIQFGISLVALYLDDSIKHPASASPTALSLSSAVASIVIIGLFLWRKWAPISRHYLQQHQERAEQAHVHQFVVAMEQVDKLPIV